MNLLVNMATIAKTKKSKASTVANNKTKKVDAAPVIAKASSRKGDGRQTMHPRYREITVVQTDGTEFLTRSTYNNSVLKLDIDRKTHPAWTKETNYVNTKNSEVAKFNTKFAGLTFGIPKSS